MASWSSLLYLLLKTNDSYSHYTSFRLFLNRATPPPRPFPQSFPGTSCLDELLFYICSSHMTSMSSHPKLCVKCTCVTGSVEEGDCLSTAARRGGHAWAENPGSCESPPLGLCSPSTPHTLRHMPTDPTSSYLMTCEPRCSCLWRRPALGTYRIFTQRCVKI